jgi:hypothetical protein
MTKFEKFYKLVDIVMKEQDNNYDFWALITGGERIGKSEFSVLWQMNVAEKNNIPFDISKNIAYTNSEVIEKFSSLPDRGGLHIDEPIRGLYKMDYAKSATKEVISTETQLGVKRLFVTLTIPRARDLVEALRNHRVKVWIHIVSRGVGIIFQPNKNQLVADPWHYQENLKLMGSRSFMGRDTPAEEQINLYSKTNIYVDSFLFPRLPEKVSEIYQAYSVKRKLEGGLEKSEVDPLKKASPKQYQLMVDAVEMIREISKLEDKSIAERLNVSPQYLNKLKLRKFQRNPLW